MITASIPSGKTQIRYERTTRYSMEQKGLLTVLPEMIRMASRDPTTPYKCFILCECTFGKTATRRPINARLAPLCATPQPNFRSVYCHITGATAAGLGAGKTATGMHRIERGSRSTMVGVGKRASGGRERA